MYRSLGPGITVVKINDLNEMTRHIFRENEKKNKHVRIFICRHTCYVVSSFVL